MERPNILFIMADQLSGKALPFYGHQVVKTPALTRLAQEGVVFENAYCNSPLCAPSRFSMMSGLLPSKVAAYDNASEFSATIPTFAHYLRLLGYTTCLSGKMHFAGADQLHGFEERLTTDIYPADFGWTPNWSAPKAKVTFQDMQNVLEAGPCARSLQIDYDDEVNFQAIRWLYNQARQKEAAPFMLTVSFTSPHDPYVAQPEFWNLYKDQEIDLPAVAPIDPAHLDAHSARIYEHYSIGKVTITEAVLQRLRHGYYASINYIDAKIATLIKTLEESGLSENTIVLFTSDHGDMMGERGLFYKKSFFEWASRVPLLFWAPQQFTPNSVSTPVSLLDLLPTFHELGGGRREELLATDGESLLPLLNGGTLTPRLIAGEYLAEGVFDPTFMLRSDQYKLFYSETDPLLLFDLHADANELENLTGSPQHQDILEKLVASAEQLWDATDLKEKIINDQTRRRLINTAHKIGTPPIWDFQPYTDASQQYVRAGKWTVEVEAKAHLAIRQSSPAAIATTDND